jgi:hypothetical protein
LLKVPISSDLNADNAPANAPVATIPAALQPGYTTFRSSILVTTPGYQHVGDPDVYGKYLFVPIAGIGTTDGTQPAPPPLIAVYRTADMSFVTVSRVCGLTPSADTRQQLTSAGGGGGWVSVDPLRKLLYASDGRIGGAVNGMPDQPMIVCSINDAALALADANELANGPGAELGGHGYFGSDEILVYDRNMVLQKPDGTPVDLHSLQGGDVSDDGNYLYLSNGYGGDHGGDDWGLRVFDISLHGSTGYLWDQASNGSGPFNFQWCDDWTLSSECEQEPEGVDYGQVFGAPGVQDSASLHVVLLANGLSEDIIYFKHYRTADSYSLPPPDSIGLVQDPPYSASEPLDGYGYWGGFTCPAGQRMTGLGRHPGGAAHDMLCVQGPHGAFPGVTSGGLLTPGVQRMTRVVAGSSDWAQGFYKFECGPNEYVNGAADYLSFLGIGSGLYLVTCATSSQSLTNICETRTIDSSDDRATTGAGDWDYGNYKGECGFDQYVAGISVDTSTLAPHSILCCNAY